MAFALLTLLAEQAAGEAAQQGPAGPGLLANLIMFAPVLLIGYFLFIRPMKRQEQERQALIAALKKNDRVITSGGIIGVVAGIKEKEDEVSLKVDENSNVRIRVTKSSIVRVLNAEDPAKEQKEGAA